jgi:assimilatory nitrate reductase catalytic subunit
MNVEGTPGTVRVAGDADFPVNRGELCVKGWSAAATLDHAERLRTPLVRDSSGRLVPATWDQALDEVARGVRAAQSRGGRDAVGVFGSGALTNEKAYWLGKLARAVLRTPHIDYNGRFCMSSASAATMRAFGVDRGLPFPLEDLSECDVLVLLGSNPAETMPPLLRLLDAQRARGGALVVVDPRESATAARATHHLRLAPGTDGALANGLLHVLVRDGLVDDVFIRERTRGFGEARAIAAGYWPERVEKITGVPEAVLVDVARLLGRPARVIFLSGRGHEQQARGVVNVLSFVNVALAIGAPGRPGSGFGALTGQGNGQGGREHGQKADQLPGFRHVDDPAARAHVASVWGIDASDLPGAGRSAQELLASAGAEGGVRALLVFGSNVVVSAADASSIEDRLRALDFLCVTDFFLSETAALAHVVLPAAQWAEEDGTVTNLEGRVLRRRRALEPPGGVRTDLEILGAIAGRLGGAALFPSSDPRTIFDELRRASAGGLADYSAITWERIDAEGGVIWGDPRLFTHRFATPDGRAVFHATPWEPPAESPDADYPLHLLTGRVLAHYQSGTQTRRVRVLVERSDGPTVAVHPRTAARHGLVEGDDVTISSRRGAARVSVRVSTTVREDTVFVPFHWGGQGSINRVTHAALDPTSKMPELKVCAVKLEKVGSR